MAYNPATSKGQGSDSIDPSVLGLPFLTIIQKGSPEFDETHAKHSVKKIEGCRPGNIVFGPKKKILAQPLLVIPVAQTTLYTEWKPRDQGGGFVGNRSLAVANQPGYHRGVPGSPTESKEYVGNNEIIYTIYFMFLFKDGDKWEKGVVSFTGTQLKHARNWLKTVASVSYAALPDVKPPMFAAQYQLSTAVENNARGSWFGWRVQQDRILDFTTDEALLTLAEASSVQAMAQLPAPSATPAPALTGGGNVPY